MVYDPTLGLPLYVLGSELVGTDSLVHGRNHCVSLPQMCEGGHERWKDLGIEIEDSGGEGAEA